MKNENGNYMLYCGDKSYEVTPEVQETLLEVGQYRAEKRRTGSKSN